MASNHGNSGFLTENERLLVDSMLGLTHKIIKNQNVDGLAHLVMHDISSPEGFGLKRAVYLVDNPDFDFIKGISGYEKDAHGNLKSAWHEPSQFLKELELLEFNNHVKKFEGRSLKRCNKEVDKNRLLEHVGDVFGMENPSVINWDMRHNNHGFFLFDSADNVCVWRESVLASVVAFLSLCAI